MSETQTNWQQKADDLINDRFVDDMRSQLKLSDIGAVAQTELNQAVMLYFRDLSAFAGDEIQTTKRDQYKRLKKETIRFREVLYSGDFEDLESDLYWMGLHNNDVTDTPDIPVISGQHAKSGKTYLLEVERLLSLLEETADLGIKYFASPRGPKRKFALENLVRRLDFIWSNVLKRQFTVDYHEGTGTTDAFAFVRTVVLQLDKKISDTQIVTAMRKIISKQPP